MRDMRALQIEHSGRVTGLARRCAAKGCYQGTRDSKPYCPDHVDQHPYVSQIIAQLEAQEGEVVTAKKGLLKTDSTLVRETVLRLAINGRPTVTYERLCRDLHLKIDVVRGIVKCLVRNKIAKRGRTRRGNTTVTLVEDYEQRLREAVEAEG